MIHIVKVQLTLQLIKIEYRRIKYEPSTYVSQITCFFAHNHYNMNARNFVAYIIQFSCFLSYLLCTNGGKVTERKSSNHRTTTPRMQETLAQNIVPVLPSYLLCPKRCKYSCKIIDLCMDSLTTSSNMLLRISVADPLMGQSGETGSPMAYWGLNSGLTIVLQCQG